MQLGNPLPVFLGIPLMAAVSWLIARWIPILESEPPKRKTLSLDGLRGVLASAVFFHHGYVTYVWFQTGSWLAPKSSFYAQLGPTAVQMFFFISGYLFWRKMLRNPSSLRPSTLFPNRMRRILPAYLAAIILFFAVSAWMTHFQRLVPWPTLIWQAISVLLSGFPIPTAAIVSGHSSFNTLDTVVLSGGILWTLQQEWFFYFLLPYLGWFRPLRRVLVLPALFLGIQLLLDCAYFNASVGVGAQIFLERFARMFMCGFTIGILAAYDLPSGVKKALGSPWMIPLAALLLACHLFLVFGGGPVLQSVYGAVLLLPLFLMVVAGNNLCGLLDSRPMRCLGTVSYSLYVFHGIILHACMLVLNRYDSVQFMRPLHYWLWIILISLIVVLWSTISYQFIERPFFSRKPVP